MYSVGHRNSARASLMARYYNEPIAARANRTKNYRHATRFSWLCETFVSQLEKLALLSSHGGGEVFLASCTRAVAVNLCRIGIRMRQRRRPRLDCAFYGRYRVGRSNLPSLSIVEKKNPPS